MWQGSDIWEQCVISGFCLQVDDNCALLGYYTASSDNFLLTIGPIFKGQSKKKKKASCCSIEFIQGRGWQ